MVIEAADKGLKKETIQEVTDMLKSQENGIQNPVFRSLKNALWK